MRIQTEFIESKTVRQSIIDGIEEMQQMIASVLYFTRTEAQNEYLTAVNVSQLLHVLTQEYQTQGEALTLVVDDQPDCIINTRPLALKRALRNLLENALKYGHAAQWRLYPSETTLLIIIEDEGEGIPEDQLERVFDPFTQLDSARPEKRGGVGLGLSVVRTLLRALGGDVVLENSEKAGQGLRARVSLPLDK